MKNQDEESESSKTYLRKLILIIIIKLDAISLGAKLMSKNKNPSNNHSYQNNPKSSFLDYNKDGRVDFKGF